MRRITRRRLEILADTVPCAVVSGRTLADLTPRVSEISWAAVIGSHGIEPFFRSQPFSVRARSWHTLVGAELAAISEVDVEHKPYGMAVHYRGSSDPHRTRASIKEVLDQLEDARVMWGARVADVTPLGAPAKDHGMEHVRRTAKARHVIYIGDDANDEDVFRFGESRGWLTIRVGRKRGSGATFYMNEQREIDRFLATVLDLLGVPSQLTIAESTALES